MPTEQYSPGDRNDRFTYRPNEVVALTGLSRSLIWKLMAEGKLAYKKCGNVRLIPAEALREFLASLPDAD